MLRSISLIFRPLGKSQVNHKPEGSQRTRASERSLWFFLSQHLLSRQGRSFFLPSLVARSTTVIGRANASALILLTSSFRSSPHFSQRRGLSSQRHLWYSAGELNQHSSRQKACIPNIPATHEAHNLLIFLNHQPGPSQVQEPKGHEPCGSPSTAPQRHNPRPQPHKLPLAQAKLSLPKQWSLP
ncbi:hypothetical protein ACFX2G_017890 [Malus domestica]